MSLWYYFYTRNINGASQKITSLPPLRTARLTRLFHNRWSVPILAELYEQSGSKFVTLVQRLNISRDSLRRTLRSLQAQGFVNKNPGYGHPLRPEYILTRNGKALAPVCVEVIQTLREFHVVEVGLNKWSMPLLFLMGQGTQRFSDLKVAFPAITSRALTLSLKELQSVGFVDRTVTDDYPPATSYSLQPKAIQLAHLIAKLAE
jgi:DNA-binding HxlR family transcriptional regulator